MTGALRIALLTTALAFCVECAAKDLVGVYYFPGWRDQDKDVMYKRPWEPIKRFPEREPLLGWYAEGEVSVAQQQIEWMHRYGIDYVVYDWYWMSDNHVHQGHAIEAFLKSPNRSLEKFSILWANHSDVPKSTDQFATIVEYWIDSYFAAPEYLKIDGKPVVFIFSVNRLKQNAERFGSTPGALIRLAQEMARKRGLAGIFFVACVESDSRQTLDDAAASGFSATSAYNYHSGHGIRQRTHSYSELDAAYRDHWKWISQHDSLPYIVPMTSGWNRKPWGGSADPDEDKSVSTPETFAAHIAAARDFIDHNRERTLGMGIVCCWNEYGEGSYVEPTQSQKFEYLERLQSTFGTR